VQHSLTLPSFAYDTATLGLLGNGGSASDSNTCAIEYGDSGSPVISALGLVHGISYGRMNFSRWRPGVSLPGYTLPLHAADMISSEAHPTAVAFVTNLACQMTESCLRPPLELQALEMSALAAMTSQILMRAHDSTITLDASRRLHFAADSP
jgi:hypothetical protein